MLIFLQTLFNFLSLAEFAEEELRPIVMSLVAASVDLLQHLAASYYYWSTMAGFRWPLSVALFEPTAILEVAHLTSAVGFEVVEPVHTEVLQLQDSSNYFEWGIFGKV